MNIVLVICISAALLASCAFSVTKIVFAVRSKGASLRPQVNDKPSQKSGDVK